MRADVSGVTIPATKQLQNRPNRIGFGFPERSAEDDFCAPPALCRHFTVIFCPDHCQLAPPHAIPTKCKLTTTIVPTNPVKPKAHRIRWLGAWNPVFCIDSWGICIASWGFIQFVRGLLFNRYSWFLPTAFQVENPLTNTVTVAQVESVVDVDLCWTWNH